MREMNARFNSKCLGCADGIKAGEMIVFQRGVGSYHRDKGCGDVYWGNRFGEHEAEQERAAYEAEMREERRAEAEYRRGRADVAAIQAVSEAGSALREALYLQMEQQWEREGAY